MAKDLNFYLLVNLYLQYQLKKRGLSEVRAVEAAKWLDEARILKDSEQRPGKPLRDLLRANKILGAYQTPPQPNGNWYIKKID